MHSTRNNSVTLMGEGMSLDMLEGSDDEDPVEGPYLQELVINELPAIETDEPHLNKSEVEKPVESFNFKCLEDSFRTTKKSKLNTHISSVHGSENECLSVNCS